MEAGDGSGKRRRTWLLRAALGVGVAGLFVVLAVQFLKGSVLRGFTNGELVGADYWREDPEILAGGFGFDNIIGVPEVTRRSVRDAGGSWYGSLECRSGEDPTTAMRTSVAAASTIPQGYVGYADYDDGLPVEFSWPVATETVDPTDFEFTLNTGEIVYGHAAGMNPNWEDNERSTVVLFGDFGNREPSRSPKAVYPVKLEIVEDDTPLTLVGPGGREVSAVGLEWRADGSPYDRGPSLVAAKLNRVDPEPIGEGGVALPAMAPSMPNDEASLYGSDADFRLRVLTSGGFSPDGVTGLRPEMFSDFFRLRARGEDGNTVVIDEPGVDYELAGGKLRVIGLADLGQARDHDEGIYYDDCYQEDRDNQIDIILSGDEGAARSVESVEIPSLEGGYKAFYNPGGPGPEPFRGVSYTAPGPPDLEPVTIALDDPMRVSRDARTADPSFWAFAAVFGIGLAVAFGVFRLLRRWL